MPLNELFWSELSNNFNINHHQGYSNRPLSDVGEANRAKAVTPTECNALLSSICPLVMTTALEVNP